jgi:hypothetical protein
MSNRYSVQVCEEKITEVFVIADHPQEAEERALRGEGNRRDYWIEDPIIKCVKPLES